MTWAPASPVVMTICFHGARMTIDAASGSHHQFSSQLPALLPPMTYSALVSSTMPGSMRMASATLVKRRRAILPFPIKGGRIHLYNNNPLLRRGYPGIIGVKTGFTDEAGRCLVAAARRNGVRLAASSLCWRR